MHAERAAVPTWHLSSCCFTLCRFFGTTGGSPWDLLRRVSPAPATLGALLVASGVSTAALAGFFGRGLLSGVMPQVPLGFWGAAGTHVACQVVLVGFCAVVVWRAEKLLWRSLKPKRS